MRWLGLLIVSLSIAVASNARAVPQPDAEAAFARGDYQTAYNLLLPLAEQGSVQAQERIAEMYEKGLGVPKDEAQARAWYRRASEQAAKDAELRMEAAQGLGAPSAQYVSPQILPGAANNYGVVPLTPMPRSVPTVVPAAWPPAAPAQVRPVQPFFVIPPPSLHHHGHHR
jgi:TPR repeat protein